VISAGAKSAISGAAALVAAGSGVEVLAWKFESPE
jgi:hypothetical protein